MDYYSNESLRELRGRGSSSYGNGGGVFTGFNLDSSLERPQRQAATDFKVNQQLGYGYTSYMFHYDYAYYGDGYRSECWPEDAACIEDAERRHSNTTILIVLSVIFLFILPLMISICCRKRCSEFVRKCKTKKNNTVYG